jgi:hypothetical protein
MPRRQRSVSLSSMRRLRRNASSLPAASSGWNSPNLQQRDGGRNAFADQVLHDRDGARRRTVALQINSLSIF